MTQKNFGLIEFPGGWKKTIDDTAEVYKLYSDKFEDDSQEVEIATVVEGVQKEVDAIYEANPGIDTEQAYSNAVEAFLAKVA